MKFFGTTATKADLFVSAKSSGLGYFKVAAWQVRSKLAGACMVGKDRRTRKSTRAATSVGCASSGQSDDSPNQPDGDESTLTSFREIQLIPNGKISMVVGPGKLPVDLYWGTRASPNVNADEAPGDREPEPAAIQKS